MTSIKAVETYGPRSWLLGLDQVLAKVEWWIPLERGEFPISGSWAAGPPISSSIKKILGRSLYTRVSDSVNAISIQTSV